MLGELKKQLCVAYPALSTPGAQKGSFITQRHAPRHCREIRFLAESVENQVTAGASNWKAFGVKGKYDGKPCQPRERKLGLRASGGGQYWIGECIFHSEWGPRHSTAAFDSTD